LSAPPGPAYLYPPESKTPNEIKFKLTLGTYLTSVSYLTIPSNILILMLPTPTVLQGIPFPINITPSSIDWEEMNQFLWKNSWETPPPPSRYNVCKKNNYNF
jgi:hypothetical protein